MNRFIVVAFGWGLCIFGLERGIADGVSNSYSDCRLNAKEENMINFAPLPNSTCDPDSTLPGIGFAQRRDSIMIPEDSLVLKYLEKIQDISSLSGALLPSQEDTQIQTFNNCMVAIAFMVKGKRERAERILDFYANATDKDNNNINKQNFYYKGEARGFYQECDINTLQATGNKDRWMGDMAWMLITCKYYETMYKSNRYEHLEKLIYDLLLSFYRESESGGYVMKGWRNGDEYSPTNPDDEEGYGRGTEGHHEGNIDCYVAFKLCGDNFHAQEIKTWLDEQLNNRADLPLDLYTWRVLAFGKKYEALLNIPEYNFCYRKVMDVNGVKTMGFYSVCDENINNFWNDGTGHIACAYQAYGDKQRGYFYANQLDHLILERTIGNETTHAIPYIVYMTKGYEWVDTTKGFVSCAAWYILAKNGINPFMSEKFQE